MAASRPYLLMRPVHDRRCTTVTAIRSQFDECGRTRLLRAFEPLLYLGVPRTWARRELITASLRSIAACYQRCSYWRQSMRPNDCLARASYHAQLVACKTLASTKIRLEMM